MERRDASVNELLVELPQAKDAHQTFSLFADKLHTIFDDLRHASLLLLPAEVADAAAAAASTGNSAGAPAAGAPAAGIAASSTQGKGAGSRGHASKGGSAGHKAGGAQQADVSKLQQGFKTGAALDWSNCCVYNLYSGRGPVVQPAPAWPVACTATCYAAMTVRGVVATQDYAAQGPHFLDWKALAEQGCVSMTAVPMYSCNRPVAVLCLASGKAHAFGSTAMLQLLGGLLAPYCGMLSYSTRVNEMRRLVNEIITPIAAQLAQQKHSQLAKLGCTVEEAPPGTVPANGKGISVAVGSHGRSSSSSGGGGSLGTAGSTGGASAARAVTDPVPVVSIGSGRGTSARQRKGCSSKASSKCSSRAPGTIAEPAAPGDVAADAGAASGSNSKQQASQSLSHRRFESVVVKGGGYDADGFGGSPDTDWSDFMFNLVSMAIVYVYFSKAAVAGESMVAVLLCMGVAAFDILLLVMRWLWFEQYIQYGGLVMTLFQAYRQVVLPIANTWMSWSLLHKMSITPSGPLIALLGVILVACVILGLQVRFFLHAPLQLASVLFAAMSTPDICGASCQSTSDIRCIGIISALQLSLGLVLPSLCIYLLEGRSGRSFLPHAQVKPELKYTFSALPPS